MIGELDPRQYHLLEAEAWRINAADLDHEARVLLEYGELCNCLVSVGSALFCDCMRAYHLTMAYLEVP